MGIISTDLLIFVATRDIDENKLNEITEAIKESESITPILIDKNYRILDGVYRFLAAKRLKIKEVPFIVHGDQHDT